MFSAIYTHVCCWFLFVCLFISRWEQGKMRISKLIRWKSIDAWLESLLYVFTTALRYWTKEKIQQRVVVFFFFFYHRRTCDTSCWSGVWYPDWSGGQRYVDHLLRSFEFSPSNALKANKYYCWSYFFFSMITHRSQLLLFTRLLLFFLSKNPIDLFNTLQRTASRMSGEPLSISNSFVLSM